jgi:hypothetical protein
MIDFSSTDFPVPEGPSSAEISPARQGQRHVGPDVRAAERFREVLDADLDACHGSPEE